MKFPPTITTDLESKSSTRIFFSKWGKSSTFCFHIDFDELFSGHNPLVCISEFPGQSLDPTV